MTFIVTARKWRPQKFGDVVGQEHITTTLKNAIKNNRIAHAYLFTGPRGVGKTTTARILAKSLNCLNPKDAEPCNECEMCKSISSTQSLDIIEIDGASNRGIDEVRTLRESVKYAPTKGKYKVYIIDEVHMLTKESFNAFLKTLEEPPSHTIFIFATTDAHKVPLTIISRCQRFDFRRIQLDTIKSTLKNIAKNEKIEIDDKTLTLISKKADGALRDAESYFDQVVSFCGNKIDSEIVSKMLNLIDDEIYFTISDAVIEKNFKAVFEVTKTIYDNGWNFIDFMEGLIEHFRNIMSVILTEKTELIETAEVYRTRYLNYIDKFAEGDILRLLNFLNKTQQELRFAQNQKLKIEISLSHLIGLERSSTISELLSNLNSGEIPSAKSSGSINNEPVKKKLSNEETVSAKKSNPKNFVSSSNINRTTSKTINQNNLSESDSLNLKSINSRWPGFVEEVSNEKSLIVGPFIQSVKLMEISGNNLSIYSQDPHYKTVFNQYQEYLSKKAFEYFGRKIHFEFKQNDEKNNSSQSPRENKETKISLAKEKDPFEEIIINDLGGEEIS